MVRTGNEVSQIISKASEVKEIEDSEGRREGTPKMIPPSFTLKDYYEMSQYRGMGNDTWYDNLEEILKSIHKLLKQKYPENDFRVKFLQHLIIRAETHEVDVEQEEALRALLHYETYPIEHDIEDIQTLCERFCYSLSEEKLR
jgi:hypothetical protein